MPGGSGVLGAKGGLLRGAGGDLELLAKLLGPLAHQGAGGRSPPDSRGAALRAGGRCRRLPDGIQRNAQSRHGPGRSARRQPERWCARRRLRSPCPGSGTPRRADARHPPGCNGSCTLSRYWAESCGKIRPLSIFRRRVAAPNWLGPAIRGEWPLPTGWDRRTGQAPRGCTVRILGRWVLVLKEIYPVISIPYKSRIPSPRRLQGSPAATSSGRDAGCVSRGEFLSCSPICSESRKPLPPPSAHTAIPLTGASPIPEGTTLQQVHVQVVHLLASAWSRSARRTGASPLPTASRTCFEVPVALGTAKKAKNGKANA
jgi:hypothetical protein